MIDKIKTNYNVEKFDEIFNDFSPEMQNALPIENTRQFFKGLKDQAGKILSTEFINDDNGTLYKTQFEQALLGIYLSLDHNNKISGLLVRPYVEPTRISMAEENELLNYRKEIAEIIFEKTKGLPNNSQLSIAVIQAGKVNYYGMIRDGTKIKPIENQNKIFEIGSITKVFTSTVLASLVNDKKIKLSDEINQLYSFGFKDNIKLTFEYIILISNADLDIVKC